MSSAVQAQAPSPDGDSGPVPGVWRRYYKVISGKATGHSDGADKNYVFNFATGDYEVGDNHGYGSASVASGGAGGDLSSYGYGAGASAKTEDVKVKVTYKWEPQGSYPAGTQVAPPDPKLNFLLRGSAYVRVNGGNEKAFASVNGKNSSANATIFTSAGATRLFSLDTKGQTELSGTMPMGVAGSGKGSVNAAFEFSSGFDDRSVSLSRVGAHDEWIEGDVTHGDTIYSYDFFGMDGARPQMNTQHLAASLGGDWTTRTHWECLR